MQPRHLPVAADDDPRVHALRNEVVTPLDLIAELIAAADVVFLGEYHGVHENLQFLCDHIRDFADLGIHAIGIEFGASEWQDELDELLTADDYDEQRVRELMFEYNVGWPLRGYQDIARAVWEYNNSYLPREPFRLINLSYKFNWVGWSGKRTPDDLAHVQYLGPIDVFRADVLEREVLQAGGKAIAIMGHPHALRGDVWPDRPETVAGFDTPIRDWTAQVLDDRYPGRVCSVLLHGPVPVKDELVLPSDGIFDALAATGPYGVRLTADSAAGQLQVAHSGWGLTRWSDVADGYIAFAPISRLHGTAIDEEFATEQNWPVVLTEWPDTDWHDRPASLADYYRERRESYDYPLAWGIART